MNNASDWMTIAEKEWNDKAQGWNKSSKNMWEHGSRKEILPFFMKHIHKNSYVLDVGCGSGYSANKLFEAGYSVEGIDLSDEMIQLAKSQYPKINFHQGDVNHLTFQDDTFESILAINVLEWTEVPVIALNELHKVLQPNGYLCIGVLGPTAGPRQYSYDRLYGKTVMMNTMMPWELVQLAEENGFQIVDGLGVPKQWEDQVDTAIPIQAQQALSFMWVFLLKK